MVAKSEVVPMEVVFKDKKYIAETTDILSQLIEHAHLSEQAQGKMLPPLSLTLYPNLHMPLHMSEVVIGDL